MMKHPVPLCVSVLLLATAGARSEAPFATTSGVLFRCQAPGAGRVYLAGSFNNWAHNDDGRITDDTFLMKGPDDAGYFHKVVPLPAGTYMFQFAVEGRKGRWFVPDEIEERDRDGNGVIRIAHDGQVITRRTRRPDWQPQITPEGVRFRLFAPEAHMVYLAGSFNNWADNREGLVSHPRFAMRGPTADGLWMAVIKLPPGSHAYQFVVDGDRWLRDPNERQADDRNHSVVVVP
jgi:1,4-alpha-glucan branching enzyme